jgi:hypothetical protein
MAHTNRPRAALVLLAVLLIVAVGLQLRRSAQGIAAAPRLDEILPTQLTGGSARDEPIAATEEMKTAVAELLNYDAGVFRIYQQSWGRISVYAAWWKAGKMSPRLVASHTPDVCWPGNGWARDLRAESKLADLSEEIRLSGFLAGECRVFTAKGGPEFVVFWHKVGEEIQAYGTGYAPPWWAMFAEMRKHGLNLRQEQLFVRVSSDKPLQEVWSRPEIEPLKKALLEMGLRAPNPASPMTSK